MDVSLTRYHIPSLIVILLGTAALLQGIYGYHMFQHEYYHEVDRVAESDVPGDATIHEFSALSTNTRDVFVETLESPEKEVTRYEFYVIGSEPTEVGYASEAPYPPTYIRYQGETYAFRTGSEGALEGLEAILGIIYVLIAGSAIFLGGWSVRYAHPRLPLTLLVGIGIMAAVSMYWVKFWSEHMWVVFLSGIGGMWITWRTLTSVWGIEGESQPPPQ